MKDARWWTTTFIMAWAIATVFWWALGELAWYGRCEIEHGAGFPCSLHPDGDTLLDGEVFDPNAIAQGELADSDLDGFGDVAG